MIAHLLASLCYTTWPSIFFFLFFSLVPKSNALILEFRLASYLFGPLFGSSPLTSHFAIPAYWPTLSLILIHTDPCAHSSLAAYSLHCSTPYSHNLFHLISTFRPF